MLKNFCILETLGPRILLLYNSTQRDAGVGLASTLELQFKFNLNFSFVWLGFLPAKFGYQSSGILGFLHSSQDLL